MLSAGGSFGGAKPKALMDIAGEPWIIKFFNNEPVDVPPIKHALMTLAKQAGTLVAQTQVVPLLGENALALRRYDREGGGSKARRRWTTGFFGLRVEVAFFQAAPNH